MKCPECGSTILKRVTWFRDEDGWDECGIWHDYKGNEMESGHFLCDCGHEFFVTVEQLMEHN